MITRADNGVIISICHDDLIKSIAELKDMRNFCRRKEFKEVDTAVRLAAAASTALEAMIVVYNQKFGANSSATNFLVRFLAEGMMEDGNDAERDN